MQVLLDFGAALNANTKNIKISGFDIRPSNSSSNGQIQAPPPEFKPIQQELAICKRFFRASYPNGTAPGTNTDAGLQQLQWTPTSQSPNFPTQYDTEMRATPTLTIYANDGTSGNVSSNIGNLTVTTQHNSASGFTAGYGGASSVAFISYQYTADAEL